MINVWQGLLYSNTPSDISFRSNHTRTLKIIQKSTYSSPSLSLSSPPQLHESDPKSKIFGLSFGLIFGVPLALFLISFISLIPCFLKKSRHPPTSNQSSNDLSESSFSLTDLESQSHSELQPPQYETVIQEPAPAYFKDNPPSYNLIFEEND